MSIAYILYYFPYCYFHSNFLPHVWVSDELVMVWSPFCASSITCARLLCLGAVEFLWSQGISLSPSLQNFNLLILCCHFFFLPVLWGCCSFLMEWKRRKGEKEKEPIFFLVWAAFVQNWFYFWLVLPTGEIE